MHNSQKKQCKCPFNAGSYSSPLMPKKNTASLWQMRRNPNVYTMCFDKAMGDMCTHVLLVETQKVGEEFDNI